MKKILIINNDFDTMDLLKQWLERKNYTVKFTGRHEEIPALLLEFCPDLFIIDSQQKGIALKLKQQADSASVPVLMMTGYSSRETTFLIGNDIIQKPLDLKLFENKINMLLNHN